MIENTSLQLDDEQIYDVDFYFYDLRRSRGFVSVLILDDVSGDNLKMCFIKILNHEKFKFPLVFKHINIDILRNISIGITPMKNFLCIMREAIQKTLQDEPDNATYLIMIENITAAIDYIEEYRTFALQVKYDDVMIAESLNINEPNMLQYVRVTM